MQTAVAALFDRSGVRLLQVTPSFADLMALLVATSPDVVVLALPTPGADGVAAVRQVRLAAPRAQLVVLSSFTELEDAALHAGAHALVRDEDLRDLRAVLLGIASSEVPPGDAVQPIREAPVDSAPRSLVATAGRVSSNPAS
ncbi:hypothetical protein IN07_17195 [Modestobacter caceresii]|uniref:Response regulatory domain-containing protein n=2 Tax=Modestobacter caceresii TaxID=1522368 RepID=A0A098Y4N8_9ACTN|nr:hypothetical protein IN07_17195 [Modestobacter caceresii]